MTDRKKKRIKKTLGNGNLRCIVCDEEYTCELQLMDEHLGPLIQMARAKLWKMEKKNENERGKMGI